MEEIGALDLLAVRVLCSPPEGTSPECAAYIAWIRSSDMSYQTLAVLTGCRRSFLVTRTFEGPGGGHARIAGYLLVHYGVGDIADRP